MSQFNLENTHPKYRPDIDGLRALAVLLVVGFHAFPQLLPGGFIGVDIFFVISGFLISTILLQSFVLNRFSFLDFYARRVRRIFPALLLVFTFSLVLGWFTLFPDEYRLLGNHIFWSSAFTQNFNLLTEIGYFDEAADAKPLLHLWSLGIEEQFYLIWPLLLWVAYRFKFNPLIVIAFIGLGSFTLNIFLTHANATIAFFSPLTRFWELLVGAVMAYVALKYSSRWRIRHISYLGILLILAGVVLLTPGRLFPGWWALLPTLGTLLIIASDERNLATRFIFSNRLMVGLGLISYPLYLWHWVLLSFFRIIESGEVSWEIRLGLLVTAFILSVLTYKIVERPIQSPGFYKLKTWCLIVLMALVALVGNNIYQRDGLAFRSLSSQAMNASFVDDLKETGGDRLEGYIYGFTCQFYGPDCEPVKDTGKKIFVWGDSHAQMLGYGFKTSLPQGWQYFLVSLPGCHPEVVLNSENIDNDCKHINFFATSQIKKIQPNVVLLAQRDVWDSQQAELLFAELTKLGVKKVLYLGKTPEWTAKLPKIVSRMNWRSVPRFTNAGLDQNAIISDANAKAKFNSNPQKQYIDLISFLCNHDGCLVYLGYDVIKGITSYDTNHLSPRTSEYIFKELIERHLD